MPKATPPAWCLNCGAKLSGRFCADCGQAASDFRLSFRDMMVELIDSQFNLNSTLIRSLATLIFRPGVMTREYNIGKRTRYISPLRLYLVTSALFFLGLANAGNLSEAINLSGVNPDLGAITIPPPTEGEPTSPDDSTFQFPLNELGEPRPITLAELAAQTPMLQFFLDRWAVATQYGLDVFRDRFVASYLDNIPKMIFVLLPVFALLLKLLYIRRDWLYLEHMTFTLHLHTFAFIVFLVALLAPRFMALDAGWREGAQNFMTLCLMVYTYGAMKTVYGQGYRKTGIKMFLLGTLYFITLGVSFLITTVIAFLLV